MSVFLVGSDCERERTYGNIAYSLQQLITLTDSVFDQLMTRLDSCCSQLNSIKSNVNRVESKLDAVSKMNTAVVIYSPSRFPNNIYERLSSVFPLADPNRFCNNRPSLLFSANYLNPLGIHVINSDMKDVIQEKGKFFHVGATPKYDNVEGITQHSETFTPNAFESVADLFVFNTLVNVFEDHRYIDPLECELKSSSNFRHGVNVNKMSTIIEDTSALDIGVEHKADPFHYEPELGILQDFDFPEILPDLPGIASDLKLSDSHFAPVAPSAKLETETKQTNTEAGELRNSGIIDHIKQSNVVIDSVSADKLEISNENAMSVKEKSPISQDITNDSMAASSSLQASVCSIPPPPPPPPPLPKVTPVPVNNNSKSSKTDVPAMDTGRSSLMEAIRRAGGTKGAKLRSVKKKQDELSEDASALPQRNILPPGDDLMTSLSKALEMRRRGISGKSRDGRSKIKGKSGLGEGVMAEISAMLPPPPKSEELRSENEGFDSDNDWEL